MGSAFDKTPVTRSLAPGTIEEADPLTQACKKDSKDHRNDAWKPHVYDGIFRLSRPARVFSISMQKECLTSTRFSSTLRYIKVETVSAICYSGQSSTTVKKGRLPNMAPAVCDFASRGGPSDQHPL